MPPSAPDRMNVNIFMYGTSNRKIDPRKEDWGLEMGLARLTHILTSVYKMVFEQLHLSATKEPASLPLKVSTKSD